MLLCVWVWFVTASEEPPKRTLTGPVEEQLEAVRSEFVKRASLPVLACLLDVLRQRRVVNLEEEESIKAIVTRAETARHVIDSVLRKGAEACAIMKRFLKDQDPYLSKKLGLS